MGYVRVAWRVHWYSSPWLRSPALDALLHPLVDFAFTPCDGTLANVDGFGELSRLHQAVNLGSTQAGNILNRGAA